MNLLDHYPANELKLIYSILHDQLLEHDELMNSELLHDLQRGLQKHAQQEGIDPTTHSEWAAWLIQR